MVRTQIYLDPMHEKELSQISHRRRVSVSELIRQAVDQFLGKSSSGMEEALEKSFSLRGKRKDLGSTSTYVRKVRREWEKRGGRVRKFNVTDTVKGGNQFFL